jgi:prepilin signal peptidase PulO-like enzyme (type II secretory pathway)
MTALPALAALCGSSAAAIIDLRTGYIPDAVTRTTALVALTLAALGGDAPAACSGAWSVGGALLGLHLLTRGRGIGLGDVKLGSAIGAGLGAGAGLAALAAAFVSGAVYAAWLLIARRARRGDEIRFGPFLAAGTLLAFAAVLR